MKILNIFLFLLVCFVWMDDVQGAKFRPETNRFSSRADNSEMNSYDFRINVIEHEGILIDAVSITDRNKQITSVPFDNGGHLLFTAKNMFLNVTKGTVSMDLPAGSGGYVCLVAGAGSHIEFAPDSFTITSSVSNADAVTAIFKGVEFPILPGETTRFIESNFMPAGASPVFEQNPGDFIPVVIFGSAYLDVDQVNIDSLLLDNPGLSGRAISCHPATIGDLNDDSYPDLMVEFEAKQSDSEGNVDYAILQGRLADGTLIKSISVLNLSF